MNLLVWRILFLTDAADGFESFLYTRLKCRVVTFACEIFVRVNFETRDQLYYLVLNILFLDWH